MLLFSLQYYPPDFDPAKLPRGQRGNKDAQMKVSCRRMAQRFFLADMLLASPIRPPHLFIQAVH